MKKKKVTTYMLLVIVLGVWGYVFRNVYFNLFGEEEASVQQLDELESTGSHSSISTDFELLEDYDDPFGVGRTAKRQPVHRPKHRQHTPSPSKTRKKHHQVKKKKETKPMPKITYHGMIKENESDEALAVITVDKKKEMVSLGKLSPEFEVVGIYGDSIVVFVGEDRLVVGK